MTRAADWIAFGLLAGVLACTGEEPVQDGRLSEGEPIEHASSTRPIDPPAIEGAFAPEVWSDAAGLLMTWLEPLGAERSDGHRLRFARLDDDVWSAPVTVVEGRDLFANWADLPSPARAADGTIYVHWLAKTAPDTYAYSIFLARSTDGGASWSQVGKLNDDASHTEHGFVSWVREGDGLRAFWLDGREMEHGGPMTLRTARVASAGEAPVGTIDVLDSRVCECCSTDATVSSGGALAVYRDRSAEEVRDVYAVRERDDGWSAPSAVQPDGWRIEGCPVNGPAVAAAGDSVSAAWFTAAGGRPSVVAALSADGGATFERRFEIDADQPLGRIDLAALDEGRSVVAWFARDGQRAAVSLRTLGPEGAGETLRIARTSMARASGFPRLARLDDSLLVLWVDLDDESPSRIRAVAVPLAGLPSPPEPSA